MVFSGPLRQHGAGFGALALGVGRVAIPLIAQYALPAAKRYVLPAAKKFGRNFIDAALPEIGAVLSGKKRCSQAFKSALSKTARKQLGGGGIRRRRPSGRPGGGVAKRRRRGAPTRKKTKKKRATPKTKKKRKTKKVVRKKKRVIKRRPNQLFNRNDLFSSVDASDRV